MNEKLPTCQKCLLAERLPDPLEMADGTVKNYACPPEKLLDSIISKINRGVIGSLPDKRSAFSGLRQDMHRKKCPSSEIERLANAPHRIVDPQRNEYSNIKVSSSHLTIVDLYEKSFPPRIR